MSESKQYIQHETIIDIKDFDESYNIVVTKDEESEVVREQKISKELLPYITTDTPVDATKLQDLTLQPIVKEILGIFLRYDPRLEDIRVALQRSGDTLMRNVEAADDIKYGVPYHDRRVHIYHELLLGDKKEIPSGK